MVLQLATIVQHICGGYRKYSPFTLPLIFHWFRGGASGMPAEHGDGIECVKDVMETSTLRRHQRILSITGLEAAAKIF